MSKFISSTTTSKQISIKSPRTNINTSSKHRATQTTPKKPSYVASSSESAEYVLQTLSLTNEAENSSSTLSNVVIVVPHYKEMRSLSSTSRNPSTARKKSARTDRTLLVTSFNHALPKISSVVNKYTSLLQSTANCKKAFPNPPVIAYRRNASLRDLLVHSTLPHENSSGQQPAGIKKCNHPRCLTCSFLREGQTNYTFFTTNEARKITDSISCRSKNLIAGPREARNPRAFTI